MEKIITNPLIAKGQIMHQRFFPKKNYFKYKSTYICFPISQIKKLKKTLFSFNKFNLFGFYNKDYGDKNSENIENWIRKILQENKLTTNLKTKDILHKDLIAEIILVTHPRGLGYVFNPISFWLCFDKKNQLIAVLCEVNNTCGQKHSYLCFKDNLQPINSDDWLSAKKEFYVSPFMEIAGKYKFRFEISNMKMAFFINYFDDEKLKLSTYLKCDFLEFNNKNLLISFLKMPFFTLKTTFLIHYQALKLYFKKIKHYKCAKPLAKNLTISKNE